MKLTAEQEAMLAGERGETMAKVLEDASCATATCTVPTRW